MAEFLIKSMSNKDKMRKERQVRKATRILDAPDVINNFYCNPLDWARNGTVGIALS